MTGCGLGFWTAALRHRQDGERAKARLKGRHRRMLPSRVRRPPPPIRPQTLQDELNRQLHTAHASGLLCVECGRPCVGVQLEGTLAHACTYCQGLWFAAGTLLRLTRRPSDVPGLHLKHRASRYRCPLCRMKMTEHVFLKPYNLLVDCCTAGHGVYLERGELKRALTCGQRLARSHPLLP